MQVAGEEHVDVVFLKLFQRVGNAADDAVHALLRRRDEGVVRHDDFEDVRAQFGCAQLDVEELFFGDFSILPKAVEGEGEGARGVDPHHHELVILKQRAQFVADVFLVSLEREEEPADHIEERDVVVAGDHELGPRQAREVLCGLSIL